MCQRLYSDDRCCVWGESPVWIVAFLMLVLSPISVRVAVGQSSVDVSVEITERAADHAGQEISATSDSKKPEALQEAKSADQSSDVDTDAAQPAILEESATLERESAANSQPSTIAAEASPAGPAHPLSVEPGSALLPKDRPDWTNAAADYQSEIHHFVVQSIPTTLEDELDASLNAALEAAMREYVVQLTSNSQAAQILSSHLSADFIRKNLLRDGHEYVAQIQTSSGPLFQKWVMVDVTPEQRRQLALWLNQQRQGERIWRLGLAVGGLLSLLGLSHLWLRRRTQHQSQSPNLLVAVQPAPVTAPCRRRFGRVLAAGVVLSLLIGTFHVAGISDRPMNHSSRLVPPVKLEKLKKLKRAGHPDYSVKDDVRAEIRDATEEIREIIRQQRKSMLDNDL
ncbi:MAG: hypothetical protein KF752_04515 [Pirellulaceae bacterium]|nr:hypothetical protein [Pirellulaceae bacterium]